MQVKQNVSVGQMCPEGCQYINYISQFCCVKMTSTVQWLYVSHG